MEASRTIRFLFGQRMRILIPGGSGQVGTLLARHLYAAGHEVVESYCSSEIATALIAVTPV